MTDENSARTSKDVLTRVQEAAHDLGNDPPNGITTMRALTALHDAAGEIKRLSEWERMFGAWARRMIPGGEPLWPNANWSQDVAMVAHALSAADRAAPETNALQLAELLRTYIRTGDLKLPPEELADLLKLLGPPSEKAGALPPKPEHHEMVPML
jgi:hypothetical protein